MFVILITFDFLCLLEVEDVDDADEDFHCDTCGCSLLHGFFSFFFFYNFILPFILQITVIIVMHVTILTCAKIAIWSTNYLLTQNTSMHMD
jgi:hypothetical protein